MDAAFYSNPKSLVVRIVNIYTSNLKKKYPTFFGNIFSFSLKVFPPLFLNNAESREVDEATEKREKKVRQGR
jgi:hypothetical protein